MKLAYRAYEKTGREVTDVIEAPSAVEATDRLRHQELFVAEIAPVDKATDAASEGRAGPAWFRLPESRSRRLRNLAMFTRQLYVLMRAGTPLAEGLQALERQAKDAAWRKVIADVCSHLERGISLAKAMEARPEYFDAVYRNMIAAGESAGKLTTVLNRLAQLSRKRLHIRRTIRSAMIYPSLLVVVSITVITVMMLTVVPRFADLFDALDVPLPPTTAMLIGFSEKLQSYWLLALCIVVALGASVRFLLRTAKGRRLKDTLTLRLPYIGGLVRSFATAQIARLLAVLLDSHLPVLEALSLTRKAMPNSHYRELISRAEEEVSRGRPISSAFRHSDLIVSSVYETTRSGEQSGQVAPLLLDLADFLDEENETALKGLISILEPTILIFMGVVVGFVALSIFTPLFDATGMVSGGAP
jgi:type IV pilus assembly protein PilC